MKKSLQLLLALAFLSPLKAQTDFSKVDEQARKIPFPEKQNVARLASDLTAGLTTEKEKARAIFVWITENISYDIKAATDKDLDMETFFEKQKPAAVLKSKKAVCEGYSNLFSELCKEAGLRAFVADGWPKNEDGEVGSIGHAWNLVQAEGEWGLIDPTWGAGSVDEVTKKFHREFNEAHFWATPEDFVQTHLPYDPLFQMLPEPLDFQKFKMSAEERASLPKSGKQAAAFPNLNDSLSHFAALDSNARLLESWSRMVRFNPENGRANYNLAFYYYYKAVEDYNRQQAHMNALAQNKVKLTQAILKEEENVLEQVQADLSKSYQLASRVSRRDEAYEATTALRREIESKQKLLAQSQKQNKALKTKVKN
jgi:hypothetical protein